MSASHIAKLESPECRANRLQQREQLLAKFEEEPELHELLGSIRRSFDPHGACATFVEAVGRLGTGPSMASVEC
jgi:hypothetical protein